MTREQSRYLMAARRTSPTCDYGVTPSGVLVVSYPAPKKGHVRMVRVERDGSRA